MEHFGLHPLKGILRKTREISTVNSERNAGTFLNSQGNSKVMCGLRVCVLLHSEETPVLDSYSGGVFLSPGITLSGEASLVRKKLLCVVASKSMFLYRQNQCCGARLFSSQWNGHCVFQVAFPQKTAPTKIEHHKKFSLCFDWVHEEDDNNDDDENSWELLHACLFFNPFYTIWILGSSCHLLRKARWRASVFVWLFSQGHTKAGSF